MFTTNHFKKLLVDRSNFDDLPEQWLKIRAKIVPYVARAYRFAVSEGKLGNKDSIKSYGWKEYSDCRLTSILYRPDQEKGPIFWNMFIYYPVNKVSVAFEPVRKSLGQFTFDYDIEEKTIVIRFFLTENSFIKVTANSDHGYWLPLKSFSLVNKLSGDEKNYYPASVSARSFIS